MYGQIGNQITAPTAEQRWTDNERRIKMAGRMKCRECGADMYLDDKDYNFKGNYDNYWNCEKCQTSCIEQVRFAKPFKEIWHSENDGVKDYTIRR